MNNVDIRTLFSLLLYPSGIFFESFGNQFLIHLSFDLKRGTFHNHKWEARFSYHRENLTHIHRLFTIRLMKWLIKWRLLHNKICKSSPETTFISCSWTVLRCISLLINSLSANVSYTWISSDGKMCMTFLYSYLFTIDLLHYFLLIFDFIFSPFVKFTYFLILEFIHISMIINPWQPLILNLYKIIYFNN